MIEREWSRKNKRGNIKEPNGGRKVVQGRELSRAHTKALWTNRDLDYYIEGGLFSLEGVEDMVGVVGCNLCELQ